MQTIKIGDREFYFAKPVLIVLDTLKNETGIDFALGMKEDSIKEFMRDLKKIPRVISIITTDEPGEPYDEEKAKTREDFFYRNAELTDLGKCLSFFSEVLSGKGSGSSGQHKTEKGPRAKMKLVKS